MLVLETNGVAVKLTSRFAATMTDIDHHRLLCAADGFQAVSSGFLGVVSLK